MTAHHAFLVHVTGVTNAGKSTFLAAAPAPWGRVEIGKLMRAKYPPSHFKGQSNPTHTAAEAWQMYLTGIAECEDRGCQIILIDGQPRDHKQLDAVLASRRHTRFLRMFLHLWAPAEILAARAQARDGADEEKLALTRQRLVNDAQPNYSILCRVLAAGEMVRAFDTSAKSWHVKEAVATIENVAYDNARQGGM